MSDSVLSKTRIEVATDYFVRSTAAIPPSGDVDAFVRRRFRPGDLPKPAGRLRSVTPGGVALRPTA